MQAMDEAVSKFADAPKCKDTDDAALLFAHQLVLVKVGAPTNVRQVEAYERWRAELGRHIEENFAQRMAAGPVPYW